MPRTYRLKQRAKSEEETRQRIVESAVYLHEKVGGAQATISAIAERAGVGRVTVYRHFPDERSLLTACTGHYLAAHPPPSPTLWEGIDDPWDRLRSALRAFYAYYGETEGMLARAEQDAPDNPILAELLVPFAEYQAGVRDSLADALNAPADPMARAAIGHALAFLTWRSLTRLQRLDDHQAIALMVGTIQFALQPHITLRA